MQNNCLKILLKNYCVLLNDLMQGFEKHFYNIDGIHSSNPHTKLQKPHQLNYWTLTTINIVSREIGELKNYHIWHLH